MDAAEWQAKLAEPALDLEHIGKAHRALHDAMVGAGYVLAARALITPSSDLAKAYRNRVFNAVDALQSLRD